MKHLPAIAGVLVALCLAGLAESQLCPPGTACRKGVCFPLLQKWRTARPSARPTPRVQPQRGMSAAAPRQAAEQPHPAVPRVTAHYGSTSFPMTGVLVEKVDGKDLARVLTAAHLLIVGQEPDQIVVEFADGWRGLATVKEIDHVWDMAVLSIRKPPAEPIAIAATAPQQGDQLTLFGYGNGRPRRFTGRTRDFASPGDLKIWEFLQVGVPSIQGDSGGAILNQRGELAGIISGSDPSGITCGPVCTRLRRLLKAARPSHATRKPLVPIEPATPADKGPPLPKIVEASTGLAELEKQLAAREAQLEKQRADLETRIIRIEETTAAGGLDNVRAVARETAIAALADRAPGAVEAMMPGLLAALGMTAPPSAAAIVGLSVLRFWLRQRRKRPPAGREEPALVDFPQNPPRDDTEARQLLRLGKLEGRDPIHDALVGQMVYDELDRDIERGEDNAGFATKLKRRLEDRFNEIVPHALEPQVQGA